MVMLDDSGDAGLLEHHLGDPGAVGIVNVTPRELSRVAAVPVHQLAPEESCIQVCIRWSDRLYQIVIRNF